jgi:HSF-type DNA-binding
MMSTLVHHQIVIGDTGGLSHLVEAATALERLVEDQVPQCDPTPPASIEERPAPKPALICDEDDRAGTKSPTNVHHKNSNKKDVFPQKLMEILSDSSLTDIVSWLPHGLSFVIIRPDLFCEQVLPIYLPPMDSRGSTKYPSFTRKLNRW